MKRIAIPLAAMGLVALLAGPANAGFTGVTGPGEISIAHLLDGIYGQPLNTFVGGGVPTGVGAWSTYAAPGFTLTRVDDTLSPLGKLDLLTGTPGPVADQFWTDGTATVTATAKYAGFSQEFGFTDGSGYNEVFTYIGGNMFFPPVTVTLPSPFTISGDFTWDRSDVGGGAAPGPNHWSSDVSQNTDGLDHMITYEVAGPGLGLSAGWKVWLLFWDDQAGGGDRDFNDFVIEIRAIPVPGAALLGVLGLGALASLRRRVS